MIYKTQRTRMSPRKLVREAHVTNPWDIQFSQVKYLPTRFLDKADTFYTFFEWWERLYYCSLYKEGLLQTYEAWSIKNTTGTLTISSITNSSSTSFPNLYYKPRRCQLVPQWQYLKQFQSHHSKLWRLPQSRCQWLQNHLPWSPQQACVQPCCPPITS